MLCSLAGHGKAACVTLGLKFITVKTVPTCLADAVLRTELSGFVLTRQVLYLVSYKPKFVIFIKLNSAVTSSHKSRADTCWALSSLAISLTLPPQVLSIAVYTSTSENPDAQSS